MFWDNFMRLCNQADKYPNTVAAEIGVKSTGTVTGWKNGAIPRQAVLLKLADYFGVTVDYLLNGEQSEPNGTINNEPVIKRIEVLIAEKGISKKEFYAATGVNSAGYSQWNSNMFKPSKRKLQPVADYFGVTVDYLLNGEQKEKVPDEIEDLKKAATPLQLELIDAVMAMSDGELRRLRKLIDAVKD